MCMLNAALDIFEKSSMYRRTSINHLSIRATSMLKVKKVKGEKSKKQRLRKAYWGLRRLSDT